MNYYIFISSQQQQQSTKFLKMNQQIKPMISLIFFYLCFLSHLNNVNLTEARSIAGDISTEVNPFTPKASLIRYWNKQILTDLSKSSFVLSKASPLSAVDSASFSKLAGENGLSTRLPAFCSSANLFCFPDISASLDKHGEDANFKVYSEKNFTNYGTDGQGSTNSFQKYSNDVNGAIGSFRRYSRDSVAHDDVFKSYAKNANFEDMGFASYGTGSTSGSGNFKEYQENMNVPNNRFSSYSDGSNGRAQNFKGYSNNANAGDQSFTSYGKNGNGAPNEFTSYGNNSNVIGSTFNNYGETANGAADHFTSYGESGNVPQNNFKNYGDGGNGAIDGFWKYRDQSNVGDDNFKSYAKNSNAAEVKFNSYGQSFNLGSDTFTGYGEKASFQKIGFKTYGENSTFKSYTKTGVTFAKYNVSLQTPNTVNTAGTEKTAENGKSVNKWVEPGKFFRESMLKEGTVMPMPDIKDKMPPRSFLPRSILSKLPFSTSKIEQIKSIFHSGDNSTTEKIILDALKDCERAPSPGETKRCVGSAEDLIDFATSVLGHNIVARTTENVNGSKQQIMIGSVKGINGGKLTKSVSCHQSLYPHLLYYCHSVPKVRVYEADILDPNSKEKINHGVAICHIDTSTWSSGHGAFASLGSGPGKIEVCHWIFENDMTWATADN